MKRTKLKTAMCRYVLSCYRILGVGALASPMGGLGSKEKEKLTV